jgi:hypothetical protein
MSWYVAWAPTHSRWLVGWSIYRPQPQLVIGEQIVVGVAHRTVQHCANSVSTMCLQRLVLTLTVTTSHCTHGLIGPPTMCQQCANGIHMTIRCLLSDMEQTEALCVGYLVCTCSTGEPIVCHRPTGALAGNPSSRSSVFCSWAPLVLCLGTCAEYW